MTPEERAEFNRICDQRNSMAVYLKHTQQCACCLHRDEKPIKEYCTDCVGMASKWEWGGWKGKPTPEGTKVWKDMDYLFTEYERKENA